MTPADLAFADSVLQRLQALADRELRTRAVRATLLEADVDGAVALLGRIVERCIFGVAPGEDAMLALIPCLLDMHAARKTLSEQRRRLRDMPGNSAARSVLDPEGHLELWDRLRALYDRALSLRDGVAQAAAVPPATSDAAAGAVPESEELVPDDPADTAHRRLAAAAVRILVEPPPRQRPPARHERFGPRWDRQVTLGERKAMAAGGNRAFLERLAYDRDPQVVRKLCVNPRFLEPDILLIVTRRPNDPTVLHEVARSRWLARYEVRRALVLNPYTATGLTLRIMPLLHGHHIDALRFAADLHPLVAEWAIELARWRSEATPTLAN